MALVSICVGKNFTMYIDEEGKFKDLPPNEIADSICKQMLARQNKMLLPGDYIAGTAIFVGLDRHNGEECDLPDEALEYFKGMYYEA